MRFDNNTGGDNCRRHKRQMWRNASETRVGVHKPADRKRHGVHKKSSLFSVGRPSCARPTRSPSVLFRRFPRVRSLHSFYAVYGVGKPKTLERFVVAANRNSVRLLIVLPPTPSRSIWRFSFENRVRLQYDSSRR